MEASGRTDLSQPTEGRRHCRHWRRPPQKRRDPTLDGTSNWAEFAASNTIISSPKRHEWPPNIVRALPLDGEADGDRLLGHHAPAQHNGHRVAEVAP